MIGYLDTSAFIPLIVDEPASTACRRFWDDADDVVTSRLTYVETAAALAQAVRTGRLTEDGHERALALLDQLWTEIDVVEVDDALARRAAVLSQRCAVRGYDAVQCASAERVADDDVLAASGDARLLAVWADLAIATFDPNRGM